MKIRISHDTVIETEYKIVKVPIKLWVATAVYYNDGEISFTSKVFPEKKEAKKYLKELSESERKEGMFHGDTDNDLCDGCPEENINQNGYNLWDNRNRAMYATIGVIHCYPKGVPYPNP